MPSLPPARARTLRPWALVALSLLCLPAARAQSGAPASAEVPALPPVTVTPLDGDAPGTRDAASEGTIGRPQLQARPASRPAEVLELVPGVVVSQHSGDGKANQYYLRGFNLDHGTDFASWLDGMPLNMPTHAHGQGYTDLNFLIPELLQSIHYRKGPYAAEDGDFSSAGSARMQLVDSLPRGIASVTAGANQYARTLLAGSTALTSGSLLHALEAAHDNGPWQVPQGLHRLNGLLRYSLVEGDTRQSLTAMAYGARWRATDQVPQRAVEAGTVDRYGAIDPTDRGEARRHSLSWQGLKLLPDGEWRASAYWVRSSLELLSNFTYFLADPVHGDQFAQAESRRILGGSVSRAWQGRLAGADTATTLGAQWRQDRLLPVGLYTAQDGQRTGTLQESRVRQESLGLHASNDTRWLPWLRSVAGLRADRLGVDVASSIAANSGQRSAWITSPRLSLVFGPWAGSEFFVNTGLGFHSNDARGTTATVAARGGSPVDAAAPLVRTRGHELGVRGEWLAGLQTSLVLWQLDLASELVFVGDAGETAASGASRRRGVEIGNRYAATRWLALEADIAWSRARFRQPQGGSPNEGVHVPGAVGAVASLGATVSDLGPWSGQLRLRHFGPRPLTEDGSVRSQGTTLANLRVGYRVDRDTQASMDVFNLFDRRASDIDYHYASRLPGEPPQGVAGLHSHPALPRTVRVGLARQF